MAASITVAVSLTPSTARELERMERLRRTVPDDAERASWNEWQRPRICPRCGKEFSSFANFQLRCTPEHVGVWNGERWTCCGMTSSRDIGCVPVDHRIVPDDVSPAAAQGRSRVLDYIQSKTVAIPHIVYSHESFRVDPRQIIDAENAQPNRYYARCDVFALEQYTRS